MYLKIHIYTCKGQRGNFTSDIHIFLLKIENTYDKHLVPYQSCQESIKSNHANMLKACLKQNHI